MQLMKCIIFVLSSTKLATKTYVVSEIIVHIKMVFLPKKSLCFHKNSCFKNFAFFPGAQELLSQCVNFCKILKDIVMITCARTVLLYLILTSTATVNRFTIICICSSKRRRSSSMEWNPPSCDRPILSRDKINLTKSCHRSER